MSRCRKAEESRSRVVLHRLEMTMMFYNIAALLKMYDLLEMRYSKPIQLWKIYQSLNMFLLLNQPWKKPLQMPQLRHSLAIHYPIPTETIPPRTSQPHRISPKRNRNLKIPS